MLSSTHLNFSTLENCSNTATIVSSGQGETRGYNHDGLIGEKWQTIGTGGKINNTKNSGEIKYINNYEVISLGGVVGELQNGYIENTYNIGLVNSDTTVNVGGIVGTSHYDININKCYNSNNITGYYNVGGIVGGGSRTNINSCYNTKIISGSKNVGGIIGWLTTFNDKDNTNNLIWYCYNIGNINGQENIGTIGGYVKYYGADNIYGLLGTAQKLYGIYQNYKEDGSHWGILSKNELTSVILTNYGNNFIADTLNKNDGYPILSWQK